MTDIEMKRRKAICEVAHVDEIDDVSDGFHTFRQLYYQRMILFAAIVKQNKDRAWKSLRHEDGELCFGGGWFIVGIDTPEGSYTYHYENKYWDMFDCVDLPRAKHWDGHTENDAETRLMSLPSAQPDVPDTYVGDMISRQAAISEIMEDIEDRSLHDDPATPEDYAEGYDEGIRNAAVIVLQMPSAQPVVISKSENATECEDAVSREAVLNEIHRYMEERDYTIGLLDDNVCGLPSVTPKQPGWIPCKTRKPEKSGFYLVTK